VGARNPDVCPAKPMRRWHDLFGRTTWLTDPDVFARLHEIHRRSAIDQARSLGLLDPDGPGSWTRPDLSRMLYADGKVVTPLFRAKPDTRILNKQTGELPARPGPRRAGTRLTALKGAFGRADRAPSGRQPPA
jgi:hypothetical protein